jgi:hypothetical protein
MPRGCIASVRDGGDESRQQTARRESNARAANSDASLPSDLRGVLQSRSLPTLGGTVPQNWRQKAILDMGLRRYEPVQKDAWATSPQGRQHAAGDASRASVTVAINLANGPLAANLTSRPSTSPLVGPAIFKVRGNVARC